MHDYGGGSRNTYLDFDLYINFYYKRNKKELDFGFYKWNR
jgi:hypothetical protein